MRILVNGLSRSGNHPIIHWLMAHFPEEFVHYNAVLKGSKPLNRRSSQIRCFRNGKEVRGKASEEFREIVANTEPEAMKNSIVTCENMTCMDAERTYHKRIQCEPDMKVLILRSYYNVMASRQKRREDIGPQGMGWFKLDQESIDIWCENARRLFLPGGWRVVKYDSWCRSAAYRRSIERKLNICQGIDGDMDFVPLDGKGSSFAKRSEVIGSDLANVAELRYKQIELDPIILGREDAASLNERIFGWRI